jgi:hypothetical protein
MPQWPTSGQYVGRDRAGDDYGSPQRGSVAESGRWWSLKWWTGHHWTRNKCGEFSGSHGDSCTLPKGHTGQHRWKKAPAGLLEGRQPQGPAGARRSTERSRVAGEYKAYLESRHNAADDATNGKMLSQAGKARGLNPRDLWFSGRRGSTRYASEEMRDWLRGNRILTAGEYRAQGYGATHEITTSGGVKVKARVVRRR